MNLTTYVGCSFQILSWILIENYPRIPSKSFTTKRLRVRPVFYKQEIAS